MHKSISLLDGIECIHVFIVDNRLSTVNYRRYCNTIDFRMSNKHLRKKMEEIEWQKAKELKASTHQMDNMEEEESDDDDDISYRPQTNKFQLLGGCSVRAIGSITLVDIGARSEDEIEAEAVEIIEESRQFDGPPNKAKARKKAKKEQKKKQRKEKDADKTEKELLEQLAKVGGNCVFNQTCDVI